MALSTSADFVKWFRSAAPYIHAFGGRTFVIAFGGEVVADARFLALIHDLNLLASLGVRLVLVHGARPQIEARLKELKHRTRFVRGLRITDEVALSCAKDASGRMRIEIEALLSIALANSPMAGSDIRVASGNFVTAKPIGIVEGVDLVHTGEVRKIDVKGICDRLDHNELVLLSPLGYSPTGEIFNLALEDVAMSAAVALDLANGTIRDARVALGGVATKPWRSTAAERALIGKRATPATFRAAAEAALRGAVAHRDNAFKVELAKRTLVRALTEVSA